MSAFLTNSYLWLESQSNSLPLAQATSNHPNPSPPSVDLDGKIHGFPHELLGTASPPQQGKDRPLDRHRCLLDPHHQSATLRSTKTPHDIITIVVRCIYLSPREGRAMPRPSRIESKQPDRLHIPRIVNRCLDPYRPPFSAISSRNFDPDPPYLTATMLIKDLEDLPMIMAPSFTAI